MGGRSAGAEDGGPLTFELAVTDSGGLQGKDSCQINVQSIGPRLHISIITMELKHKGPNVEANAYVTIVDDAGNIVKEASVTGNWTYNGNLINTATTTTRGDGAARLDSDKIHAKSGAVFAVEITDVVKDGYSDKQVLVLSFIFFALLPTRNMNRNKPCSW